ncbi:UDP-N-acetylmuramoyl-tripeptide--D-alanyl-D-alanine ligase [Tenacibaculum amylolyticum]|uniref:UDP-N-acetylmuramoyl-tripeptide--D-alanyl-D- alanine ligase n=1 Tax=Tenacibaculum amylolyticum TaxID=104269 RepID=UPI0038952FD1
MKIEDLYKLYQKHFLVDTDTRKIRKNTIFFALKGDNFNGNKFAEEALNKGAFCCVVDEEKYRTNEHIILVDNVLETLQKLANYHRKQLAIPVIGLTGSNGKTTTKELINAVLSKKYKTNATSGNLNNHIGVPLTLLSMNPDTEIGIVEMGANHHGEIKLLSNIAAPSIGYITNFGKAHLEGFGSVEGVIEAKSELYDFLIANNKQILVNQKDKIQVAKTENADRIFLNNTLEFINAEPFVKLSYENIIIQSNLIGSYNYPNIAAAITLGSYFNVDIREIKEAIEHYVSDNNRSQILKKGTNEIILDAYNANPTSMKAALDNFNDYETNNKMVILGDMFELGGDSEKEHQFIASLAEKASFSKVILIGENFYKSKVERALKFKQFKDFEDYIEPDKIVNMTILIKGSRGMALERSLDFFN